MATARITEHTPNAVLLGDGRVLIAGGYGTGGPSPQLAGAEIYNPANGAFVPTGSLAVARACHTMTLLPNGKVLIAGGHQDAGGHLASAELYDPGTGSFTLTSGMRAPHFLHTATLLSNGKVLVVGGYSPLAELYDPEADAFSPLVEVVTARYFHTAALLPDDRLLLVGGCSQGSNSLASLELGPSRPGSREPPANKLRVALSSGQEEGTGQGAETPTLADGHGELPRKLIEDYLLGKATLTPEQERQHLGFDPRDAVEERHPEEEELARWAGIALVGGKFRPGWWELPAACRGWRIPVDDEPNNWLPVIAACMRELFGRPFLEEELVAYLFSKHGMPPSKAGALSLADLANLLQQECDRRKTSRPAPQPPRPREIPYMPFRPYKRPSARIQSIRDYQNSLQIAALNSGAEEQELERFGGRYAVVESIRRHMPTFDPSEATEPNGPAWLKLKPILVRMGLSVDDNTTLTDIKSFLDATCPIGSPAQQTEMEATMPDPKRVFVIYGRNTSAYDQMVKFLRALKLNPKGFNEVSSECGANPTVLQIVRHGMEQAAGVVAMFTADEWAVLRPKLNPNSAQNEETQRWQARPNVIFEAGLALGIAEERTVLVVLGHDVRLFSDAGGIHYVKLNNGHESRNLLRGKLKAAGCQPDMETGDHLHVAQAGDFETSVQFPDEQAPINPFALPARRSRGKT
jgi:predicted nucleotide-binding protein